MALIVKPMSTISEWVFHHPVPVLLAISGISFLFMLGGNSLWDVDEPNNVVCAREMLEAGNWLVPVFNGALRFDKPIPNISLHFCFCNAQGQSKEQRVLQYSSALCYDTRSTHAAFYGSASKTVLICCVQ